MDSGGDGVLGSPPFGGFPDFAAGLEFDSLSLAQVPC